MSKNWEVVKIGGCFEVNPQRQIQRGTIAPFVPMEALPTNSRKFSNIYEREFNGSGQKFVNGDTLIARISPCLENGKTAYVMGLQEGSIGYGSTEYIILRGIEGRTDNLFAYYLARTPKFRNYAIGRMEGTSGRQRVPATAVESYDLLLPPLDEQKVISSVLGALDDKIENNNKTNKTLEEMARAIFKSWFIDFDPVHSKASGNIPAHMDSKTAALFPKTFGDNGLPLGWIMGKIKDIVARQRAGKLFSKKTVHKKGTIPVLDQSAADIIGFHNEEPSILASPSDRVITFANHTCVLRLIDFNFSAIQNVIPFKGKKYPTEWVLFASYNKQKFEEYKGHWPTFLVQPVILPDEKTSLAFTKIVGPIVSKISANLSQNQTLIRIRDTLLPKLMSGEIRVKDAEREVEVAV